jgi:hypothetical protein
MLLAAKQLTGMANFEGGDLMKRIAVSFCRRNTKLYLQWADI